MMLRPFQLGAELNKSRWYPYGPVPTSVIFNFRIDEEMGGFGLIYRYRNG